jgi:hypothetical protein
MHINENNTEKCAVDLVGGFGMYQKYYCFVLLSLLTGLNTVTYTSHLISLMTPDHWCRDESVAALSEQLPLTLEDSKKFSVPPLQTLSGMSSSCWAVCRPARQKYFRSIAETRD